MRPQTRTHPTVETLESRELLSSLPVVPSPAVIHVEKASGRGSSGTDGSSIGTLHGTASFESSFAEFLGFYSIFTQECNFTMGTGTVKPFGRVKIGANGRNIISTIASEPGSVSTSLEGPIDGAIDLANASGRVVGLITVQGDSWGQFDYQEQRAKLSNADGPLIPLPYGPVIASGTGTFTFPKGEPTLKYNPSTGSSPLVTVPFKLTL